MMKLFVDVHSVVAGITLAVVYKLFTSVFKRSPKKTEENETVEQKLKEVEDLTALDVPDAAADGAFSSCEPGPEPQPESECSDAQSVNAADTTTEASQSKLRKALAFFVIVATVFAIMAMLWIYVDGTKQAASESPRNVDALGGRATPPAHDRPPVAIDLERQTMTLYSGTDITYYKVAYYATLKLGTPSVGYTFVFDTGSGHLILPSAYCQTEACLAHKRYRRSSSSSAQDIDADGTVVGPNDPRDQLTIQFGTGEVTGVFVDELVCMEDRALQHNGTVNSSDLNDSSALVESGVKKDGDPGCVRMRMIAATEMSSEPFKTFVFDGILGLGLDSLSRTPEFNFMHVLSGMVGNWGQAELPGTFAMFLGEGEEKSEMLLGGWSQQHLDGDLFWNPVHEPELGHWMINVKSIRVDDQVLTYCDEGCRAVVDSGTSLMAVPSITFAELYDMMWHQAAIDGDCYGRGPQLHIELDHFTITLGPEDYSKPQWFSSPSTSEEFGANPAFDGASDNHGPVRRDVYCRPLLMTMDIPEPVGPKLFILGEPVLRKYYTVYDTEEKRVGIGRAYHKPQEAQAESRDLDLKWEEDDDSWWYEHVEPEAEVEEQAAASDDTEQHQQEEAPHEEEAEKEEGATEEGARSIDETQGIDRAEQHDEDQAAMAEIKEQSPDFEKAEQPQQELTSGLDEAEEPEQE